MDESFIENQWETYLDYGEKRFVKKNKVLYTPGETNSGFYYIYQGVVRIVTYTTKGDEKNYDFRGKGQVFGEYALINEAYPTSAITKENCILYYFSRETFREIVIQSNEFLNCFLKTIYKQIWNNTERLLLISNTKKKVVYSIITLREINGGYDVINVTQQELANYLGLSRITVNKHLQILKRDGLIETNKNFIIIKDFNKLVNLSE